MVAVLQAWVLAVMLHKINIGLSNSLTALVMWQTYEEEEETNYMHKMHIMLPLNPAILNTKAQAIFSLKP